MQRLCIAIILSLVIPTTAVESFANTRLEVSYQQLSPAAQKEVDCLANNIYFESAGEPIQGQRAVALVTLNRLKNGVFGTSVCSVVKQKTNGTCQFSWWCNTSLRNKAEKKQFNREQYSKIKKIATNLYLNHNNMKDITKGALFFHAARVPKRSLGVKNLQMTVQIGQHIFYRT